MCVCVVDKAGYQQPALQVGGILRLITIDQFLATDSNDAPVIDNDDRRDCPFVVERQDLAIDEDVVDLRPGAGVSASSQQQ